MHLLTTKTQGITMLKQVAEYTISVVKKSKKPAN